MTVNSLSPIIAEVEDNSSDVFSLEERNQSTAVDAPPCLHLGGNFAWAFVCPAGVDTFSSLELSSRPQPFDECLGCAVFHLGRPLLDRMVDASIAYLQRWLEEAASVFFPVEHMRLHLRRGNICPTLSPIADG